VFSAIWGLLGWYLKAIEDRAEQGSNLAGEF